MAVTLKLDKSIFVPKYYPLLFNYSHRWEIYMGSAGSAKSYFITQKIIARCWNEPIKVLVCRRTATTIRNTCFSLFKDILTKWRLYPQYVKIRETDFNIKFPNGSEIIFSGLDEETKLLSLNNIGCIFIEEAFEVPKPIVE
ncbi:MAG: phage terminase large subunit [Clostridia bacterium]|nr:phage terminase large subunit [Clostridia bacterium]